MALSFGVGGTARGGSSLTLRAEFGAVRTKFWLNEAATNSGAYSAADLLRMRGGKAPIGPDGFPLELHHKDPLNKTGTNDISNLEILSRSAHRLGENYRRNHPPDDEN
ncbi:HNH endonuclease, partial [Gemmatimonas sp.]